jgi:hypothetical protein
VAREHANETLNGIAALGDGRTLVAIGCGRVLRRRQRWA